MKTTFAEPACSMLDDLTVDELGRLVAEIAVELGRRPDPRVPDTLASSMAELGRAMGRGWPRPLVADTLATPADSAAPWAGGRTYPITMHGIREAVPGRRWRALFDATWPAYRAWYSSEGDRARPDLATCRARLVRHMPELVGTWEQMVDVAGGDEVAARMLTQWNLPRFLPGCSQAVVLGERPALVRNYDYSPGLFEQVVLSSRFTGRKVIGTSDCLWGLLDGMNEDGLMVSLAFGGRPGSAPGFAIPIVVRYLLEVAASVREARSALERLPVAMAYNLTMADRSGKILTAFVAPAQSPEYTDAAVATNHRGDTPEYPEHARSLRSVERQRHLRELMDTGVDRDALADAFLRDPLRSTAFSQAFGTLYTAIYRPDEHSVQYRWPGTSWTRTFDSPNATVELVLRED
jgi:predicted choloylglycine hydrolase